MNVLVLHKHIGSNIVRRCSIARVGVALLEKKCVTVGLGFEVSFAGDSFTVILRPIPVAYILICRNLSSVSSTVSAIHIHVAP